MTHFNQTTLTQTYVDIFAPTAPAPEGFFPSLIKFPHQLHSRYRQRLALRKALSQPHLLSDIGVTYAQAKAEADKPFWRA